MGFFAALDRPFNPVTDWGYLGPAVGLLSDSVGRPGAVVVRRRRGRARRRPARRSCRWRSLRLTRLVDAAPARRRCAPSTALGGGLGRLRRRSALQLVPGAPVASTQRGRPRLRPGRARSAPTITDQQAFAQAPRGRSAPQHPRRRPADRPARQGRHHRLRRELRAGRGPGLGVLAAGRRRARRRDRAGCARPASPRGARSSPHRRSAASAGWPTPRCSPGCGSTASSATTSSSRSDRLTLSDAFRRAGWRTVADVPSNTQDWPEGTSFYHYDKIYDATQRRATGARSSATPPCPTSTPCRPSSGSSWRNRPRRR